MLEDSEKRRLIILGTLLAAVLVVWWPEFGGAKFRTPVCDPTLLCVVFLDVGQGDSIYVQSPSGGQILIDAGVNNGVLRELNKVMNFRDRDLDYVLLTHPDQDHVGGFLEIFERYQIGNIIRTENESDSEVWQTLLKLMTKEEAEVHYARRGQQYDLGGGVVLEILFPDLNPKELESNTSSIVARLEYGETSLMFTGDAPKSIEEYLVLVEGENLQSDVLKVGHHGSRTSSAEIFIENVDPVYAVISVSSDNTYGHPHTEVLDTLFNAGVTTYNTAQNGQVVFWSDGREVNKK